MNCELWPGQSPPGLACPLPAAWTRWHFSKLCAQNFVAFLRILYWLVQKSPCCVILHHSALLRVKSPGIPRTVSEDLLAFVLLPGEKALFVAGDNVAECKQGRNGTLFLCGAAVWGHGTVSGCAEGPSLYSLPSSSPFSLSFLPFPSLSCSPSSSSPPFLSPGSGPQCDPANTLYLCTPQGHLTCYPVG